MNEPDEMGTVEYATLTDMFHAFFAIYEIDPPIVYSPVDWKKRGYDATGLVAAVVHEGQDCARFFDYEHCCPGGGQTEDYWPIERMNALLASVGCFNESLNGAVSCIYCTSSQETT